MSKLTAKYKSLSGKAAHKESGDIPSGVDLSHLKLGLGVLSNIAEAAGITPLSRLLRYSRNSGDHREKGRKYRGHQGFCSIHIRTSSKSEQNCSYKWWYADE
ncbi:hypothetical protein BT96DRAFT_613737 [Gymnopus androsaceus JB14]|uniref:Uncharacterized protein n=1 Tax=Gymnopus androsaceus JB14 TaxID=1447944 RepID=A0A6A4GI19_9AGAR|nr:hypothetical protein BT96DRAFT_613737 [Gymnopus androsaceus JB14]